MVLYFYPMNARFTNQPLNIYVGLALILIISRLIPHPPNFTAATAAIVFAAVSLRSWMSLVVILFSYWISDLVINNWMYSANNFQWITPGYYWIAIPILASFLILRYSATKSMSPLAIFKSSFWASLLFFLISNLGVWQHSASYSKDLNGLSVCYINAIPFFGNELAGTLFYTSLIYCIYWLTNSGKQLASKTA